LKGSIIFARGDKLEHGHYTVLKELGVGGMGVVYQCKDEQLLRDVAIKMLLPELMSDKNNVEIFRQEARFAAKLEQPNIVTVYDIGVEERQNKLHHFVSMEYLPGGNLANKMASGALNVEHCLNWMKQLASGLNFAHKNGVIHQDIKADNIFITNEGDLKIGDFGLARLLVGRVQYNSAARGMGTPAYMSPELCRGEIQDHRSDIYSLGILFFEMCTGQLPYRAKGMIEMATKHSSAPIPSASRLNPNIPEQLDKMLRKMMEKMPDQRYQATSEIITLLDDLIFERRVARLGLIKGASVASAPAQPAKLDDSLSEKENTKQSSEIKNTKIEEKQPPRTLSRASPTADLDTTGNVSKIYTRDSTARESEHTKVSKVPLETQTAPAPTFNSSSSSSSSSIVTPAKSENLRHVSQDKGKSFVQTKNGLSWTFKTEGPIGWASTPLANKEETILFVTSSDGQLYAIEIKTGRSLWHNQTAAPFLAAPAVTGNSVISANTQGVVQSQTITDGTVLWKYETKAEILATPVIGPDTIFIATKDGRVLAIESLSGKVKWIHRAQEPIVCSPSMHADMVLVGTRGGSFLALSAFDGKIIWKFNARSPIVASPAASVDSVYFGTMSGEFYALDAQAGDLIWEYQTEKPIVARAVIAFTSVIFASFDKWLYCCEKYDGSLKWKAAVRGKAMANLVVDRDNIFANSQEGFTQMFNTKSGALIWQKDYKRGLESSPLVTDHYFFQATIEGEVFAYERARD
jgi:serine/threonine-protein kinase